jgi:hypothetical protein
MRVELRTDIGSLATGALMAGLFNVAAVKHVFWDRPVDWTADALVIKTASAGLYFLLPFLAAHLLLSRARISNPVFHVAAGAGALLLSFALSGGREIVELAAEHGMASIAVGVPALFGCMLGFLYVRRAGFAASGDDPRRLTALFRQPEVRERGSGAKPAGVSGELSDNGAFAAIESADYYSGPLQVKTSLSAVVITGISAGGAWAVMKLVLGAVSVVGTEGSAAFIETAIGAGAVPLFGVIITTLMGALLFPVPVYIGHMIARSRDWTGYGAYAAVGALIPIAAGTLMFVVGLMVTGQFVVPMALAMIFYRNLAGLEPKALPEDIQVSDRRALVGANHLRRRYSRAG